MNVDRVRQTFADRLRTIDGLNADPFLVDRIRAPHAMVDYEAEYDLTMGRGSDVYMFVVQVWVQRSDEVQSQKLLDQLRDPDNESSVKQVLEHETTVNAAEIHYARVLRSARPVVATVGAVDYLMVEFETEVVW